MKYVGVKPTELYTADLRRALEINQTAIKET